MHDMNNNNPNKYYNYDTNLRYMQNNSHRSHHPPSMFDNPRNDYYNGPPSYMNPNMMNNNMIPNPNSGYNHFSSSYPASGNGSFYRSFRQNWQPQVMPQQHRPMPPPQATQPQQTQQTPVSQGQQSSQSTSSQNRGFSSTSSRNNRAADESQLAKLKQNLAITQKELTRVTAEKMKLEVEEQRLQKIVEKTKSDIEKLDTRLRDPRVKSRPETISVSSSSSSIENLNCGPPSTPPSLDRSCTSTFTTTTVPSMTSLSSTPVSNLITNSVPSHTVSNIPTPSDLSFTLLSTNNSRSSHTISSGSSISNNSNSLLVQPAPSIPVPVTNQSNSSVNGSLQNTFSSNNSGSLLAFPRNMNKNVVSRGKQLNNLIEFKQLPIIFEVFGDDLLKPEIYPANQTKVKASFSITPKQMELLQRSPQHRVLLRICYFKNKNTAQSDRVSRKLAIRINSRPFSLGKQTSGSIKAPLDITTFIDTRNEIELCWPENEPGREYGLCVSINQRLSLENSLKKLQETDYQRPSSDALKMISKNFATSGDICSEEIMVPLCCPITKKRLEIPAIGLKCEHLLCFDAKSFLDINQKRLEWHCPSCKKAIGYNDIRLDCLITEILSKTPSDCLKVSFDRHGTWHPVIENKEKESTPTLIDVNKIDIITLDDSDEENMKGYDDPPEETPTNEENEAEGDDQEDEEDDDETDQDTEEDEEVDDDDDSDNEDEDDDEDEEEEEEGEITDKDGSNHGRCERSRRYEDDPDFVYPGNDTPSPTETPLSNGSRERKKKQLFEIFGSDADSRENSPDSSVRSPINKNKKRRRERSERRSSRKGRRHE